MPQPIIATKTVSGASPKTKTLIEEAAQTFLAGVPVMVDAADGGVKEWTGNVADLICGFSAGPAHNFATTGADAPKPMMPYTGLGATMTYPDAVPNQPLAKMIPIGAPFVDGRLQFFAATRDTVFEGVVGAAQATTRQMVGVGYGLTKDGGTGLWYVDTTKVGADAVVTIQDLHPLDGPKAGGGRVWFAVNAANAQIVG